MERLLNLIKKHKLIAMPVLLISFYILGYLLLVISYCFPTDAIRKHISQDMYSVLSVGEWIPGHDDTVPDYYTDSLMLLEAEYDSDDPAFISSVKSPRALIPGYSYVYETYIDFNEDNGSMFYEYDYYRYWHGYLILLKPLLSFFSLGTVKYLTVLFQFILIFLFLYMVIRSGYPFRYAFPMLAAYLFMNPLTVGLSFQYNTVYAITVSALTVLFADHGKKKIFGEMPFLFFFLTGIATSYFDLLTFPLLTFGIPAVYYYLLYAKNEKKDFISYISSLVSWAAGYGGMWAGKWIIATAVVGREVFGDISNSISVRSGFDASESFNGEYVSYFDVLNKNLSVQVVYGVIVVVAAFCIILFGILKKKAVSSKESRTYVLICLVTGFLPFIWYFLLPNHSWIHYWFTFRTLAVSVCALVMISLVCMGRAEKINE